MKAIIDKYAPMARPIYKPNSEHEPQNPLDWYTLTETANSTLNELIAYTASEELKEMEKDLPDLKKIEGIRQFFHEIHTINSNPENFKSIKRMQEIINIYAPQLKSIYESP
jgi:hypothetical protein